MTRDRDAHPFASGAPGSAAAGSEPAPGRRTLTEDLAPRRAAAGVEGEGRPLPHLDRIQASFGKDHDLSGVRAHVGGAAAEANESLGAHGYAFGGHVAFREQPDLRLAAHEAAHVVQQSQGVHMSDGLSHPGDAAEVHADRVADRVVAGVSAADLLPSGGARSFGRPGPIQRWALPGLWGKPAAPAAPAAPECSEDASKEVQAFKQAGPYRLRDHVPSTGAGAFDVDYYPMSNSVIYRVRLSVQFVDYNGQKWGDDKEKNDWWAVYLRTVYARWDGKYHFQVRKSCWESLRATPLTEIVKDDDNPHFRLQVKKMAAGNWEGGAVNYPDRQRKPGHSGTFTPQDANIRSTDTTLQHDLWSEDSAKTEVARMNKANPRHIRFGFDSDKLPSGAPGQLAEFGRILSMTRDPKLDIDLTGHASNEGDPAYNLDLSTRRANTVKDGIKSDFKIVHDLHVIPKGQEGAGASPDWRRVDITVRPLDPAWKTDHDRAGHEFGHMIGLDDEYDYPGVGKSRHYQLVEESLGRKVADVYTQREKSSASLMADGLDVRPYHYVTFWEALGTATEPKLSRHDWKIED